MSDTLLTVEDLSVDFIADFMKRHRDERTFTYYPMALPHWPMVPAPNSKEWSDPTRWLEEDTKYPRTWWSTWTPWWETW